MTEGAKDPMRMRALKAVAIVMALLLMVPGVEAIVRVAGGTAAYGSTAGGIDAQSLVQAPDPFAALDRVDEFVAAGNADVPEEFSREIGFLPGASDIRVDATGSVVGYAVAGDAGEALDGLVAHMEARGWTAVSLGGVDGATFVKEGGSCTWALATCTQVDDATSVVVRCMRP